MTRHRPVALALAMLWLSAPAWAQQAPRPTGRVSFYATTDQRRPEGGAAEGTFEFATSVTFRTPEIEHSGFEVGVDVRHTGYSESDRPQRLSIYDGFVGARLGSLGQFRARVGHLWMPDLGTAGSLAGGLVEFRSTPPTASSRWTAGAFAGGEPLGYEAGYADGIRKYGGYVGFERGFLQRHVVGFAHIKQRGLTERSMLSVTNYVPAGRSVFVYQALEYDLQRPAGGAARSGLSYFLVNARASAGSRVELQGTYHRGRAISVRQLTDDVLNGRPLKAAAIDGLRYETVGGRVTVRVKRQLEIYGGYAQDRNNREDQATGRLTLGAFANNVFGTSLDLAASDARIDRPTGPYHSRYVSIGRSIGRSWYVSGDYSTSLAVVRFLRSDGVTIETRPWTRRLSGNVSATLNRQFSLIGIADYTMDEGLKDLRVMTGLTWRLR